MQHGLIAIVALCAACSPSQQKEVDVDRAGPAGTSANAISNESEGPLPPKEAEGRAVGQPRPEQVVARFAGLLEERKFAEAFTFVDAQALGTDETAFEDRFADYSTINAAVGPVGATEGAAGSLYSEIQLTLSGNKKDGSAYVLAGPLTLKRVNDVPGSTADQRRWRIVKMELSDDPRAAGHRGDRQE